MLIKSKMTRITQAVEQINRFMHSRKPVLMIQTKTSYERYIIYKYLKQHKLPFEKVVPIQST